MTVIKIEQDFSRSKIKVWNAITQKPQMKKWFFPQIKDFEPQEGFKTAFDVEVEGIVYRHLWEIQEVIACRKIVYKWRYKGFRGDSVVKFELKESKHGTNLMLIHDILEDFPADNPVFSIENIREGWNFLIKNSLKNYLDSQ